MKKPTVISISTAKGGVGKTTTTVALAEFLASKNNKKILVIDADYQTNCTVALIGNHRWEKLNSEKKTLVALLEDAINEGTTGYKRQFDPLTHIYTKASNISEFLKGQIDLIPSSPDLNNAKNNLYRAGKNSKYGSVNKLNFLEWGLRDVLPKYDFVIIDIHPDIDDLLYASLYISDYYLMPVIPDAVSSYGVKTMITSVKNFTEETRRNVRLLGVLISMLRQIKVHKTYKEIIENMKDVHVFETHIPQNAKVTEAMEFSADLNTLKQKYGYSGMVDIYSDLVEEVLERCRELEKL